jgi:hypothetical protein
MCKRIPTLIFTESTVLQFKVALRSAMWNEICWNQTNSSNPFELDSCLRGRFNQYNAWSSVTEALNWPHEQFWKVLTDRQRVREQKSSRGFILKFCCTKTTSRRHRKKITRLRQSLPNTLRRYNNHRSGLPDGTFSYQKIPRIWRALEWKILAYVWIIWYGICYGNLVYLTAIWLIL